MTQVLQYTVNGISVGAIYAVVALGLALVYGGLRIPNFAHGAFVMVGAYFTYTVVADWGVNYWLAIPIVIVVMGAVGAVQEVAWFRVVRNSNTLVLILVSFALYLLIQSIYIVEHGSEVSRSLRFPLSGYLNWGGVRITYQRLVVIATAIVVVLIMAYVLNRTRMGREIRAVAEDPDAASLSGVNVSGIHTWVFVVSTSLAGIGGLLLASLFPIQPSLGENELLKAFAIIIVAGKGNNTGLVAVAFSLGVAESLATGYLSSAVLAQGLAFLILAVALLIRPQGLAADPRTAG